MNVYLDNNVLIDIEKGKRSLEHFLQKHCEYYYSDVHLNELLEGRDNPLISQEERLAMLTQMCGKNCIITGVLDRPEFIEKDPHEMYKIVDTPLRSIINQLANQSNEVYSKIREQLGFDGRKFNNEEPEKVLKTIDKKMKEILGIGLLSYLLQTEALGGKPLYNTLVSIIDAANYWGDKKTDRSTIARMNDAAHAYSAQICDVLVTDDKKMRAKIRAVYSFLGVSTKVMSVDGFLYQK